MQMYGLYSQGIVKDATWKMEKFTPTHWKRTSVTAVNFGLMLFARCANTVFCKVTGEHTVGKRCRIQMLQLSPLAAL